MCKRRSSDAEHEHGVEAEVEREEGSEKGERERVAANRRKEQRRKSRA